jgi:hypothetical protein
MSVVPYALAASLLLRDTSALLAAELGAELAATQAALSGVGGPTMVLPAPKDLRRAYWPATRDRLPQLAVHVMERRVTTVDSANRDSVETSLAVFLTLGEGDTATQDESGYSDAIFAYLGAVSGLLQRRLPQVACSTSGVHTVIERALRWEPDVSTVANTWIQRGRLDLTVMQTVWFDRPPLVGVQLLTGGGVPLTTGGGGGLLT